MTKLALTASIILFAPAAFAALTKKIEISKLLSLTVALVLILPMAYAVLMQVAQIVA